MTENIFNSTVIAGEVAPLNQAGWWRCLLDHSEDAQVVCCADGMVFAANAKARRLLALPEAMADCRKHSFLDHLTDIGAKEVAHLLQRTSGPVESVLAIPLLVEGRVSLLADMDVAPLNDGFSLMTLKDANHRWLIKEGGKDGYAAVERANAVCRVPQEISSGERDDLRDLQNIVTDPTKLRELERQESQAWKMESVGALADDLDNLIQVICGNVSLLSLEPNLSDSMCRKVQKIEQAAAQTSTLTQQLLLLSHASGAKNIVVDFNQVIQEAGQLLQRSVGSRVELKLAPAASCAFVWMDCACARQIVFNLCVNALDAMPNGGCLVLGNRLFKLTSEQAARTLFPPGADFVCCSVSNAGPGMAQKNGNRIFDPCFTTRENGMELGLTIVRSIVRRMHGFIDVESESGQGTVFKLCMPCAYASSEPVPEAASRQSDAPTGRGRILVVDDLDLVLELTVATLSAAGYEAIPAASAEAALEILQTEEAPIDLLFTDYNMKGMNGGQLIEKAAARSPNMKFIMASGFVDETERNHLRKIGRVRILDKPFNMRDATAMIAKALASNQEDISIDA
jgi:nitrogen-specific signal transduction histidine kinase/ActR/RegA family two-component response regulator